MATIRLVPSTYEMSSSTYLSISDVDNMYTNTDSTTYADITNTRGTTDLYLYLRGFNFSDLPSDAVVNSFSVKFKYSNYLLTTWSSYARAYLVNNTTTFGSYVQMTGNTSTMSDPEILTFTVTATWDTIKGYGSNFGLRIPLRKAGGGSSDSAHIYIYGAEIEVDYTSSQPTQQLYVKENGVWVPYSKAYIKTNGVWVEQSDITTVFDTNSNYRKMN